jgi:hypothetical protein
MPLKRLLVLLFSLIAVAPAAAQDDALAAVGVRTEARQDAYGQTVPYVAGQLVNRSADAYTNLSLLAQLYDAQGALIGEGLGYLVNVCGAGLLPDFVLQPHTAQALEIPLELYESDAVIDRVDIIPQGTSALPDAASEADAPGIRRISNREVIAVEWLDDRALRFGVGCSRDAFTDWRARGKRFSLRIPTRQT